MGFRPALLVVQIEICEYFHPQHIRTCRPAALRRGGGGPVKEGGWGEQTSCSVPQTGPGDGQPHGRAVSPEGHGSRFTD